MGPEEVRGEEMWPRSLTLRPRSRSASCPCKCCQMPFPNPGRPDAVFDTPSPRLNPVLCV
eukprot:4664006-Alexandrium_andersonii.AAC.1